MKNDDVSLRRMWDSCQDILRYIDGRSSDAIATDRMLDDAIRYRLSVIGEESARLSMAFRAAHPLVDWQQIDNLRRFTSEYFVIDVVAVWSVVTLVVPDLAALLSPLVESQSTTREADVHQSMLNPVRAKTKPQPAVGGRLPDLVAHADWSAFPGKRWFARAELGDDGRYVAYPAEPVGDIPTLLQLLQRAAVTGRALVGFDFPIGLPISFADRAGITDFLALLPNLGGGEWGDFYNVATNRSEISLRRPFYPHRPGGTTQEDLIAGLGLASFDDLRRRCELPRASRPAACPLFWTLGANQVGKAAISGWREVLYPTLSSPDLGVAVWPFDGPLSDLVRTHHLTITETYPAECYHHLGVNLSRGAARGRSGKKWPASRAANGPALHAWAAASNVALDPVLVEALRDGFGPNDDGEDPFDALIGLFGMLNVLLGRQSSGEPSDPRVRRIEGWILGRPV